MYHVVLSTIQSSSKESSIKKKSSIKRGMKSKTRIRRAASSELSFGKTPTYIARVVKLQPLE